MKRAVNRMRKTVSRKEALAARLALIYDQRKALDAEIAHLKKEVLNTFGEKECVGRVTHTTVNNRVLTDKLWTTLQNDERLEDVLAPEKIDMKKLDALLKICPQYAKFINTEPSGRVDIKKKAGE